MLPLASGKNIAGATLAAALAFAVSVHAPVRAQEEPEQFAVNQVWFAVNGPGRFLNADMRIPESQPLRQTLESGLQVDFALQVLVQRKRWWWLDESAADIQWRAALSYDPILRRYELATADGFRREYPRLQDALNRLGVLRQWPVAHDIADLFGDPRAYVLARVQVDVSRLPQPIKILLLTDDDWDFDSGWKTLPLEKRNPPDSDSVPDSDSASQ